MAVIGPREIAAATRVLAKGDLARYYTSGESETSKFERELGAAMGTRHALAVNSGTSALICALVGASIGPGDEVLVPAYTWVSTAAAVISVGAVPILVDIDESLTIDPIDIKARLTGRTKAIIPVHMINLVADMEAIGAIAEEHDLIVIEDSCQAIGVTYRGRRAGSIGDAGVYSFNQHKNLRSGEGGALVTDDPRIFARAGMYHDVGSYERSEQFDFDEPAFVGVNSRMPELSAAILRPQLRRLDKLIARLSTRRSMVVERIESAGDPGMWIAEHHDPAAAVGVAIAFDDPDRAAAFGAVKGARRLSDTGRHVYTNWQSILSKHPQHPRLDPYAWNDREITYDDDTCARTLEILDRTCTVDLAPELPTKVFELLLRRWGGTE